MTITGSFLKQLVERRERRAAEEAFDREHGPRRYVTEALPESEWHQCPSCNGTGLTEEIGDLHRSPGIIPCRNHHCHRGVVRSRTVEIKRRVRVKAGRQVTE